MEKLYVIFGGTFNPIHNGHIFSAKNISKEISIKKIIMLPNNYSLHKKKTKISIIDKLNMIKLAIKNEYLFDISYLESTKKNIFYTVDTLKKIRKKIGDLKPLCFMIGMDQFYNLHLWKDWKKLLHFTHLLVLPRTTTKNIENHVKKWTNNNITKNISSLHKQPCGLIFFSKIPIINISSSQIRQNYYNNKKCYGLLPSKVEKYIILNKLYRKSS